MQTLKPMPAQSHFGQLYKKGAARFGVRGTVANKGSYVEILAQGTPEALRRFAEAVRNTPPDRAVILGMDSEEIPPETAGSYDTF